MESAARCHHAHRLIRFRQHRLPSHQCGNPVQDDIAIGRLISMPYPIRSRTCAAAIVVPLPEKGS
jgi:hypothetical protein